MVYPKGKKEKRGIKMKRIIKKISPFMFVLSFVLAVGICGGYSEGNCNLNEFISYLVLSVFGMIAFGKNM